jgi:DNA-binding Lrp family transcriptional regulator
LAVRGYVLIQTDVGRSSDACQGLQGLSFDRGSAQITKAELVAGPYDVIAEITATDLNALGKCITEAVQRVPGVLITTTCLAVRLT